MPVQAKTNYNFSNACGGGCSGAQYIQKQDTTTTLIDTGLKSTTQYIFNSPATGKPDAVKQYDFYSGSLPLTPLGETDYSYTGFDLNEEQVFDAGHNPVTDTIYHFSTNASPTSGVVAHGSQNAGGPYLTSVDRWIVGSSYLTTSFVRDDTGAVLSTTDSNGTTSYGYDATNAFVTSTALPSNVAPLSTSQTLSAYTGEIVQSNGFNSGEQTNSYYDSVGRLDHVTQAGAGTTTYSYVSANDTGVSTTLSGSVSSSLRTLVDAFGRLERTANYNGQPSNPWYQQDTCYDSSGRVSTVSVPYAGQGYATAKTCSGTTYTYDALNRPLTVQNADGTTTFSYRGRATSVTDVSGVQKITQVDGLGRTTAICEVSTTTPAPSGTQDCPLDIAGSGYLTGYSYGAHSIYSLQGSQQRTFTTDGLGRTTYVSEPERGVTTYSYTNNPGSLTVVRTRPKANQSNTSILTTTTTGYDMLGRISTVSYSNDDSLTATKYFYYEQVPPWLHWSSGIANAYGRLSSTLTSTPTGITTSQYSYDLAGRVINLWQCAPSICGTSNQESRPAMQFGYDQAGNLTYEYDGVSGAISYSRSPVGEVQSVTNSSYSGAGVVSPNPAYQVVPSISNGPFGPTNWSLGNGLNAVRTYDSMGRNNGSWVCSNGSTVPGCNGYEVYGNTTVPFGLRNLATCDTTLGQCQNHYYDSFNRLTDVAGWNTSYHYQYDRWGNRTNQSYDSGGPNYTWTYDGNNHVNNYPSIQYDAAGNQTHDDAGHSYTYDAEGKVVKVDGGATATYVYDALDQRVQVTAAGTTSEFVYDTAGRRVSSWYAANNAAYLGRIYWDYGLLANRSQNGTTYFHHGDWLGTERRRTDYQGNVVDLQPSLADGESFSQWYDPTGASQDNAQYTGQEYDAESGTDHFQYRQYQPAQGRWMSPDPYDGSYDYSNPESFNRYAYVLNNPYTFTDPDGLQNPDLHGDAPPYGSGDDDCNVLCDIATLGLKSLFDLIFSHKPVLKATGNRANVRTTIGEVYTNDQGQYVLPVGIQVQYPAIPGPFTYNGTLAQFTEDSIKAGLHVSTTDMALPFHKGYQFRGRSRICSPHVVEVEQKGAGRDAITSGVLHYDIVNPLPEHPSIEFSASARFALVATGVAHGLVDVIPDYLFSWLKIPGTTGDDKCFFGGVLIP